MANKKLLITIFFIIFALLLPLFSYSTNKPAPDQKTIMAKTAKLQIPFIENQGQIKDKGVRFYANTFAGNVYVTEKGEIVYGLIKVDEKVRSSEFGVQRKSVGVDVSVNPSSKPVAAEPRSASSLKSRNRSSDLLIEKNNTPKGVFLQNSKNENPPKSPFVRDLCLSYVNFVQSFPGVQTGKEVFPLCP